MKDKTEKQAIPVYPSTGHTVPAVDNGCPFSYENMTSYLPPKQVILDSAWQASNALTTLGITTGCILAVQSPVKTVMLNFTKHGSWFPSIPGGRFALIKALYAGTMASLTSSTFRTTYVTGVKDAAKSTEGTLAREESVLTGEEQSAENARVKRLGAADVGFVAAAAAGEVALTNIPTTLSALKKVPGLLPEGFNWKTPHNAASLMKGGFGSRYASSVISFMSLCLLEESLAERLSLLAGAKTAKGDGLTHALAGVICGATAAVVSSPFSMFNEYTQVRTTVNQTTGNLHSIGARAEARKLYQTFLADPSGSLRTVGTKCAKQLPVKVGLTATIFGIIAGTGALLGPEPLNALVKKESEPTCTTRKSRLGFFAQAPDSAEQATPATPTATESGSATDTTNPKPT